LASQDDSAYTNGVAAASLNFCIEAAGILEIPVPPLWQEIASNIYLPLSNTLYPGGPVHPEYTGTMDSCYLQQFIF
jgi:hypothetical protein